MPSNLTPRITFLREVVLCEVITVPVAGTARVYKDYEGDIFVEVRYDLELMERAIDKGLLPILEEATDVKHFRRDGKPIPVGGVLLKFRDSIRDKDYSIIPGRKE